MQVLGINSLNPAYKFKFTRWLGLSCFALGSTIEGTSIECCLLLVRVPGVKAGVVTPQIPDWIREVTPNHRFG